MALVPKLKGIAINVAPGMFIILNLHYFTQIVSFVAAANATASNISAIPVEIAVGEVYNITVVVRGIQFMIRKTKGAKGRAAQRSKEIMIFTI